MADVSNRTGAYNAPHSPVRDLTAKRVDEDTQSIIGLSWSETFPGDVYFVYADGVLKYQGEDNFFSFFIGLGDPIPPINVIAAPANLVDVWPSDPWTPMEGAGWNFAAIDLTNDEAFFSGGVLPRVEADFTGGVVDNTLTAPTGVLTRNVGDGSMEVQWTPGSGAIDRHEIWITDDKTTDLEQVRFEKFSGTFAVVRNLPFGKTIFTKVRAVDAAGNAGPYSDWAHNAIVAGRATTVLRATGPSGAVISNGAIFVMQKDGLLVALQATQQATLS